MTAKIFRNAFLIGFTVLLACMLLFFFRGWTPRAAIILTASRRTTA